MISVTKPSLPPLEELQIYLKDIWKSEYITNSGKFHNQLEDELAKYLGVNYISVFSNGTLALITALQALKIQGEVITTPYSFVATTNSLIWNGIEPVFVDIDPANCNLAVDQIEKAITDKTTAIMPVHVYGVPCDVDRVQEISDKHNLKVIYDAAHAFGINKNGQSVLNYGDLSILSFHATKVFNTIEGGAIISHTKEMKTKIDNLKNFGIVDELTVVDSGINAKMNEVQAAYGLINLKYIDQQIGRRKLLHEHYDKLLQGIQGIKKLDISGMENFNYGYYPIFIDSEYPISRDEIYQILLENEIYTRRYFYPLITDFPIYSSIPSANPSNLPNASLIAKQVLCLPMYANLEIDKIEEIVKIIKNQKSH